MQPEADVVDLHRIPTRRYDLQELKARLALEREATEPRSETPHEPGQVWFVGVAGRRVGPLTRAGLEGLKARGQLAVTSLVWREGWPVWAAAEAVPELRPLLGLSPELAVPLPRELAAPPLPAQESLPFAALVEEVTDPAGLALAQAAAAPTASTLAAATPTASTPAAEGPGASTPADAGPARESPASGAAQVGDGSAPAASADAPGPAGEATDPAAVRPAPAEPTGTSTLPRSPRVRTRRADAQFSAPSDSASRPALRYGFAVAVLALAALFTARACAPAPAHPQATGGAP